MRKITVTSLSDADIKKTMTVNVVENAKAVYADEAADQDMIDTGEADNVSVVEVKEAEEALKKAVNGLVLADGEKPGTDDGDRQSRSGDANKPRHGDPAGKRRLTISAAMLQSLPLQLLPQKRTAQIKVKKRDE